MDLFFIVSPVEEIHVWWKSIRTRFGKLSSAKYMDEAKELTDRDKYILENLKFLEKHIARVPSRQNCSVGQIYSVVTFVIKHPLCNYGPRHF